MSNTVPFLDLKYVNNIYKNEFLSRIEKVIDNSSYILGVENQTFERKFSEFTSTKYALGVSNGLDAIQLSLLAAGVKSGDEVIVPAHTFIATWLAVSNLNARPVPVEVDDYYCISPSLIETAVTPKTKAIIAVHLYGHPCDMDAINSIAQKYNLVVIEDNAQAQGALYKNRLSGSLADLGATSFYPGKNIGAMGDAGAITTSNYDFYNKLKMLRNYGSSEKYIHDVLGFNNRMDEIQAAVINIKLKFIDEWNEERRKIAKNYLSELKGVEEIVLPKIDQNVNPVWHLFVIRLKQRNQLQEYLLKNNIQTLIHYPIPPHLQKAYSHLSYQKGAFPFTEEISQTVLSLPIYPGLSEEKQEYVINTIKSFSY